MKLYDVDEEEQQLIQDGNSSQQDDDEDAPIRTGGYGRMGAREKPALDNWS
jgi:hypothetical protein